MPFFQVPDLQYNNINNNSKYNWNRVVVFNTGGSSNPSSISRRCKNFSPQKYMPASTFSTHHAVESPKKKKVEDKCQIITPYVRRKMGYLHTLTYSNRLMYYKTRWISRKKKSRKGKEEKKRGSEKIWKFLSNSKSNHVVCLMLPWQAKIGSLIQPSTLELCLLQ